MNEHMTTLRCETSPEGILTITLDRPDTRNAINTQMGRELREIFAPLVFEAKDVRCIIVTGSGDKAFCSGGDLKERNGMSDADWRSQHALFEEAGYAIMNCSAPVIAAVNGGAFGGGCELALACDFIYAATSARFALTETSLGIIPGLGGTQNLPRAVGERRAKELIMSARLFSAQEALEWGMVNQLCEDAQLMSMTLEAARRICANGPVAVRQAKKAIHYGLNADLRTGLAFEIESYNRTVVTEDRLEGVKAFVEKRKPRFAGK
ncbi:MAG: Enoyl-CoA hydratase [Betaproteobacteria bacterium]|jgi:enoyl-CoA hydratase|nr:Enoyl-CoA hydratase [Betaproteobacteria bacterium]MEA3152830.1 enoyl-CoA hydratase [Betaproteobacteria bacterium]